MDKKELIEVLKLMDEAGVQAQLCDTPVPVSLTRVPCGPLTELGNEDIDDYVMLPKSLVGNHPEMYVPAIGDSMVGAGYEDGDQLRVRFGVEARDGDNVLVWVDGGCTVKTLFTDEEGMRWLVPQNDKYNAIELTEDMDVRILGVVIGVEKANVRASSRQLLQSIRRTKNNRRTAQRLTSEKVDSLIVQIGEEVKHARQWFAVYKAMVEYEVQQACDYQGFCTRIRVVLPEHTHLPESKEIGRMEVQSFAKPISMWVETNAPASGARFRDYHRIALTMLDYLSQK